MKIERHKTGTKDKWIIEPNTSNEHVIAEIMVTGITAIFDKQKKKNEETVVTVVTS